MANHLPIADIIKNFASDCAAEQTAVSKFAEEIETVHIELSKHTATNESLADDTDAMQAAWKDYADRFPDIIHRAIKGELFAEHGALPAAEAVKPKI